MSIISSNLTAVNQLVDAQHKYMYELWKTSCANNWMPTEIPMANDIKQWNDDTLSDDEKLIIKRVLGFFSGGESLVGNSIGLVEFKYITDGACKQYLSRKMFEESLHNSTVEVCCESLKLNPKEVAEAYLSIPSINAKKEFVCNATKEISRPDFTIDTIHGKQEFVKNLVMYYIIMEGIWFYPNFALILSLGRQNKMIGICDQIKYTARDEANHIKAGVYFINSIKQDHPNIWTDAYTKELETLIQEAVKLEEAYAKEVLPNSLLGLNSDMFIDYCKYIANRRLESIGLKFRFDKDKNPFSWLSEILDIQPMAAFFERRERSYQHAGVLKDDF